jgi:glycosyltransferase involved in cell wall biosynthesis
MYVVQTPRRFVRSHWGGTETVILETSKRLLAHGHKTKIICPMALTDQRLEVIEGVEVLRTPYFYPYLGLSSDAKAQMDMKGGNLFSFALMKALKQERDLDLIHLHTAKRTGGIGRFIAIKRRIPYVVSLHGGLFDVPTEEAATWTEPTKGAYEWGKVLGWWVGSRRVFDDAAAIICVGEEERKQTQSRYPTKNVVHLPNGVDPEFFSHGDGGAFRLRNHIPADAYEMLTVGRIDPQKNQMFLVKHLRDLIQVQQKAHLLIIGHVTNQSYYNQIMSYVSSMELADRVTVIPGLQSNSNDIADAYHCADLFVLPSIHEPFGIVILEAWASGLPVIASRVGGIPSFVDHRVEGLLFQANNDTQLVSAVKFLAEHPEEAAKIAIEGKKKAITEFSWDNITGRLIRIYEESIRENSFRK